MQNIKRFAFRINLIKLNISIIKSNKSNFGSVASKLVIDYMIQCPLNQITTSIVLPGSTEIQNKKKSWRNRRAIHIIFRTYNIIILFSELDTSISILSHAIGIKILEVKTLCLILIGAQSALSCLSAVFPDAIWIYV